MTREFFVHRGIPSVRVTGEGYLLMAIFPPHKPASVSVRYSGPPADLAGIDWEALRLDTLTAAAGEEVRR